MAVLAAPWLVSLPDGSPATGASPVLSGAGTYYGGRAPDGARTPPAVFHLGGGLFSFFIPDADLAAGVVYLADNDPTGLNNYAPRRTFGVAYSPTAPFAAAEFEDAQGVLASGTPTLGGYIGSDLVPRTPPALASPATGLWTFTPTAADVALGVGYRVDAPAGAYPLAYSGGFGDGLISSPVVDSVLEAVRAELVANATVASLVGTRIYPLVIPQTAPFPAIVLTVVSSSPENSFEGSAATRLESSRLQVDCYAVTYRAAHQLATAVDNVLGNLLRSELSAERDTLQDDWDDEVQVHRVSMDFMVWR